MHNLLDFYLGGNSSTFVGQLHSIFMAHFGSVFVGQFDLIFGKRVKVSVNESK